MPRTTFDPENAVYGGPKFNKLSLESGETARIVILDREPWYEYYHLLKMPVLNPDNSPQTTIETYNGREKETIITDFVGSHLCFGDPDVIKANGLDVEACPTCRAAREEEGINGPLIKFAFHIFQYATKAGGGQASTPMSGQIGVWTVTPKRWDGLIELAADYGDLREVDLILGPCKSKQYQNFEIKPAAKCVYSQAEDTKNYVARAYKENQYDDLSESIARRISKDMAEVDIRKVVDRYAVMNNRHTGPSLPTTQANAQTQADVAGLLDTTGDTEDTEAAPVKTGSGSGKSFDDFLDGLD